TLAMRNTPGAGETFREYLLKVKENTLQAFDNQEYPFEDLVDRLSVRRDTGRNPLFDVMFNLLNPVEYKEKDATTTTTTTVFSEKTGGNTNKANHRNNPGNKVTSKFDLTLNVIQAVEPAEKVKGAFDVDRGDRLTISFEYCTKLFKEETIKRFITYFNGIIQTITQTPEQKIGDIEIITGEEKKQILYEFNDTAAEYHRAKTIHRLFEEQEARTPDTIAVSGEGALYELPLQHTMQITYRELNEKTKHLATHLINKGVEPGSIVGIKTGRTVEMIVGILAVLKAGGAYLPIDPTYPSERIRYMLTDSNAGIMLTDTAGEGELNGVIGDVEKVDVRESYKTQTTEPFTIKQRQTTSTGDEGNIDAERGTSLAYVIYTSGSTGKPKGVMIEHASFLNFIKGM
ncbi:MAG: AMP-binding protein, partial [bacterium]|nr:AMP-binding protein [bacterium]